MRKPFATLLLVSLTLILSTSLPAAAQENPVNLNPVAAKEIGRLLIEGQICAAQLSNTRDAYKVCIDDHHPSLAWWQQPTTVIGGVTVTFSLGLILGLTHCFGGCK